MSYDDILELCALVFRIALELAVEEQEQKTAQEYWSCVPLFPLILDYWILCVCALVFPNTRVVCPCFPQYWSCVPLFPPIIELCALVFRRALEGAVVVPPRRNNNRKRPRWLT
jgi:hypothetical protein